MWNSADRDGIQKKLAKHFGISASNINAYIYVPWLVCPADNLIDWNTQEDYEETLISQKE